ncbi:ABC transporter ATP-binding protein/permease [Clostridium estertheticum]|uniref:ABC transporter ATP-binding protein n=1 Tax=Clostridium estertheticum TaxID=238834 RepID=UPI0013E9493A|nr:ABC transporter ATP-binding protein [Clostridium estertheticum]MBZ9686770.1 ABC transporter ATP-binding protein/permease [Clostridium estertheticum]
MTDNKYKDKNNSVNMPTTGGGFGRRNMAPVVKPKTFVKTVRRLWSYFGAERKTLIIIFIFIIIDSAIVLMGPYLIGRAVNTMTIKSGKVDFNLLSIIVIALLISYLADAAINLFQGFAMASSSQRIVKTMRNNLFLKLQKLPMAFFDTNSHGDIMSRLSNDIDNVSSTISQSVIALMSGVITIVGSFIMMIILSPILTVASLITVPLVFLLTGSIAKKTGRLFKAQQMELGKLNGLIEETISGNYIIKAFNHEAKTVSEFDEINERLCAVGLKAQIYSGFLMPIMNVINNIGFAAVAGVGGILAVESMITVGVIASFLSYSRQFVRPLNNLANIFNTLQSAVAGAERVFEILDAEEETEDVKEPKEIVESEGHVQFNNVYFGYRKDVNILKDINFEVQIGESVALVGPTGAGKTTIVNLLTRFYDVSSGIIYIDGVDIREYTRDSLRRCFGIVLQDTYLFTGTIKENIKYGNLDATDIEVQNAAKMANAHEFIKRLPKGYETLLSESGSNLSQGQRQLLAIARAILTNPSILILDEATSSVDTRTELRIQEAMLKLMHGRTSFIIAHRLSTIRDANKIMVIDDGQIIEMGNHAELINKKGKYYNMYFNQYNNSDDE